MKLNCLIFEGKEGERPRPQPNKKQTKDMTTKATTPEFNIQEIGITEKRHIMLIGEATINGVSVLFAYNTRKGNFGYIVFDEHKAWKAMPHPSSRSTTQGYLIGIEIAKELRKRNLVKF